MWAKFLETENAYAAQIWKELLNQCAVSVRVVPRSGLRGPSSEFEPHDIYVPWGKVHVAEEILRKS
jgi:hypothetical protein